jgi:hypothetical protein
LGSIVFTCAASGALASTAIAAIVIHPRIAALPHPTRTLGLGGGGLPGNERRGRARRPESIPRPSESRIDLRERANTR